MRSFWPPAISRPATTGFVVLSATTSTSTERARMSRAAGYVPGRTTIRSPPAAFEKAAVSVFSGVVVPPAALSEPAGLT